MFNLTVKWSVTTETLFPYKYCIAGKFGRGKTLVNLAVCYDFYLPITCSKWKQIRAELKFTKVYYFTKCSFPCYSPKFPPAKVPAIWYALKCWTTQPQPESRWIYLHIHHWLHFIIIPLLGQYYTKPINTGLSLKDEIKFEIKMGKSRCCFFTEIL